MPEIPVWLSDWMDSNGIALWGVADLRGFPTPTGSGAEPLPVAISWVIPMARQVMAGIQQGPNQAYADEYDRVNRLINEMSEKLADEITDRGAQASPLAASHRTDPVNIKGVFPHKTAATRAGLGWVGRNCQLVTRPFGPWVRLATVFTDLELPANQPFERDFCGTCKRCIEACPTGALTGDSWYPGKSREEILDVQACDEWKKENYLQFHEGHNCGICSAVCPAGLKVLKREENQR